MIIRPSSPITVACINYQQLLISSSSSSTTKQELLDNSLATKIRRSSIITTSPPPTTTRKRLLLASRKSVTFAPIMHTITDTLSHRDMTYEEKQNTWMQNHEAMSIKIECKKLITHVENFGTEDLYDNEIGDKICFRGLEPRIRIVAQQKKRIRLQARHEVFCEQEEQYKRGEGGYKHNHDDNEAIAAASRIWTSDCQIQAEWRANLDRYDIENYLKE